MDNDNPEYVLKSWLDKSYPGKKLPKSSLDLHNFMNDVIFEFHRSLPQLGTKEIRLLKEAGFLSYSDILTHKGRMAIMKLLA